MLWRVCQVLHLLRGSAAPGSAFVQGADGCARAAHGVHVPHLSPGALRALLDRFTAAGATARRCTLAPLPGQHFRPLPLKCCSSYEHFPVVGLARADKRQRIIIDSALLRTAQPAGGLPVARSGLSPWRPGRACRASGARAHAGGLCGRAALRAARA